MNLAAIDIGSNAVRLLVSEAVPYRETVDFTKLTLLRIPLRLGVDVFQDGFIGEEKASALKKSIRAFQLIMDIYGVERFRACATSAMRDAQNGEALVREIFEETGLQIEIITGKEEAAIIYDTHMMESDLEGETRLYVDVGGGSTELTMYSEGKRILQDSFNVGTLRLLQGHVPDEVWNSMKSAVKSSVKGVKNLTVIGSGGNINKLFSISKIKDGKSLSVNQLDNYYKVMSNQSVIERMHEFNLRQERAEVIVPALQIYTSILKWSDVSEIGVPRIGLADGLIRELYYNG
ncbi:MAG: exopolyphosphatase [Bacteroidetes bacterium]|nr:exopolyphosphatase [Bacteroidota bacterium]